MPYLAILLAVVIWGASFIATKAAVADLPPVAFGVVRFALATLVLVLFQLATRRSLALPRGYRRQLMLAGFLGITCTFGLENIALKYTTAGNGALFIAASPILTVGAAVLFLKERLTWNLVTGALLAFGGMALLVGANLQETGVGDALMALNTLVGACYGIVSKPLADRLPPLTTLTWSFLFGTLLLVPVAVAEAFWLPAPWHWTPVALGALGYLGIVSSCLAYYLWMYALGRMHASTVGVFLYLMPLVTLLLSAHFLHEALGPARLAQACLVLVGVFLASGTPWLRRENTPVAGTGVLKA